MNLLAFGLKNIGTIQSLISGASMIKQFIGNNNGFYPYQNPYYQQYLPNQYFNQYVNYPYNYQIPPFYQNYKPNPLQNFFNLGNTFRSFYR